MILTYIPWAPSGRNTETNSNLDEPRSGLIKLESGATSISLWAMKLRQDLLEHLTAKDYPVICPLFQWRPTLLAHSPRQTPKIAWAASVTTRKRGVTGMLNTVG